MHDILARAGVLPVTLTTARLGSSILSIKTLVLTARTQNLSGDATTLIEYDLSPSMYDEPHGLLEC